jgi:hypothetical protein
MLIRRYFPFIITLGITVADELRRDELCFDAVYEVYGQIPFVGSGPDDYWPSVCQNHLKVNSIYAAATRYCSAYEIKAGTELLGKYCIEYGETELLPISEFKENLTQAYLQNMRIVEKDDVRADGPNITETIMISDHFFSLSLRTVVGTLDHESYRKLLIGIRTLGSMKCLLITDMALHYMVSGELFS